jgi:hypothetical protein
LLGLFFYPEDGSDMFLRNARLSPKYTALEPIREYSLNHDFLVAVLTEPFRLAL